MHGESGYGIVNGAYNLGDTNIYKLAIKKLWRKKRTALKERSEGNKGKLNSKRKNEMTHDYTKKNVHCYHYQPF